MQEKLHASGAATHKCMLPRVSFFNLSNGSYESYDLSTRYVSPGEILRPVGGPGMLFSAFHRPCYSTLSGKRIQTFRRRQRHVVRAGLGDSFRKISESLNFENWAPRSSRAWRLGIDINKEKADAGMPGAKHAIWPRDIAKDATPDLSHYVQVQPRSRRLQRP